MDFIDVKVLPRTKECMSHWGPPAIVPERRYVDMYKMQERLVPIPMEEQIAEMKAAGIKQAVIYGYDLETTWNWKTQNEALAKLVEAHPDFLIAMGSVDPHKGMKAVKELDYAVRNLGIRGVALPCWMQRLRPNDKRYYPIYAKAAELDIPVNLHMSSHFDTTITMDTGNPIYLDEIAVDFPELKLIASHAGWPWILQMIAVGIRHPNVFMEISGISPKYLHADLVKAFDNLLQSKVMFATGYPLYPFERAVKEFLDLPLRDETKRMIAAENARTVYGMNKS